jgi:hypothetical protein
MRAFLVFILRLSITKPEVWVNDQAVGTHEGGFTPFSFQVDEILKPGEINHIIMRVVGPILMTDQRIDEMGRMEVPQWRGAITGGIWQDVWIQRRGKCYRFMMFFYNPILTNLKRVLI